MIMITSLVNTNLALEVLGCPSNNCNVEELWSSIFTDVAILVPNSELAVVFSNNNNNNNNSFCSC
jgi:hypothetical protein